MSRKIHFGEKYNPAGTSYARQQPRTACPVYCRDKDLQVTRRCAKVTCKTCQKTAQFKAAAAKQGHTSPVTSQGSDGVTISAETAESVLRKLGYTVSKPLPEMAREFVSKNGAEMRIGKMLAGSGDGGFVVELSTDSWRWDVPAFLKLIPWLQQIVEDMKLHGAKEK